MSRHRNDSDGESKESQGNLQAAIARTLTRSIALYFSRPVRLFRPPKVSGWDFLRGLAHRDGGSLSPRFIYSLVNTQGLMVIPKHFLPPMMVNAVLGTVLWTTYGETSSLLERYTGHRYPLASAALSGAVAGTAQAVVAAPAENVRLLLEGGTVYNSWSHAWKEVFRGTVSPEHTSTQPNRHELRQIRSWVKDVGDMAGRGWNGWGFGCIKDACGFAVFFSIFEMTRQVASYTRSQAEHMAEHVALDTKNAETFRRHFPSTVNGLTLVIGGTGAGFAYELVGRPFDVARKIVKVDAVTHYNHQSATQALWTKLRDSGILYFFRDPNAVTMHIDPTIRASTRRAQAALRTLGRVGPWGVGFLVWEAYSPDLITKT